MANADAGIVNDDVQATESDDRIAKSVLYLPGIADIRPEAAYQSRQLVFNFLAGRSIAIKDHHAATLFDEARRGCRADAAGAAGNEDAFVFEASHGPSA